ncbi:MAG: NADPH:quinone oxidoreductase family protein [Gammaproteobacteria bacterium]|nr:NADPH:quinone oxidoreductase family protein [Gammaproteobacteria bacterium]NND39579.1 NADPH:quinone oxidoreductase family protein [Pseudomonadales bacterium]NNL10681.1 NADPH:quinone oxidoreductase family protein [Pseudomonadales bacterium]NNM12586.1 NADPH:quinone oxidoreductase family protein [Pseudomonadales bacterium]RZV58224.1 MAG: NADPH:quinone oxidoreductase family protein [Pseudomonadales bacterium]
MKALVCKEFASTDKLVVEEMPAPVAGDGEILIDVKAAGINFPDVLMVQGNYQIKPELPFVPGTEGAGVVAAVGAGVKNFKLGDRVIFNAMLGSFATQCVCPAVSALPMPDALSFEQGAGFSITYGTSYYALKQRANLQPGETVLVLGAAGGVGVTAIQIAKAMGAKVIAAASTEEKLDFAEQVGADMRINYSTENLKQRLKELTDGKGVDVIYDPVGGDYTEQAYRSIAWYGRYLVIGFASGPIPKLPLNLPLLKCGDIIGVFWGSWAMRDPKAAQQNFLELLQMIEQGKFAPITTEVYDLDNSAEAFRCISERRARGKVILRM